MKKIKQFLFHNTSTKQTVAKNTFWLFFGDIGGRILKLSVIIFATRMLGVEGWGTFAYALAFVSLFYALADIGINTFITREMSRDNVNRYEYLSASLVLKLVLLTISCIASLIFIPHFGKITLDIKIILVIGLLNFSDSIREFALSMNRALEKMEREAFIKIVMSTITAVLGITLLITRTEPLSLAIAYATGSIIASIATIVMLLPEFKHVTWKFPAQRLKVILGFAWPFVAIVLFSTAIASIDSIMLGQMKSATEVGLYASAQRLVQFLSVIPIFIALSIFPLMAKNNTDSDLSTRIFEKIMTIVLALGIPIAIGGLLVSPQLIVLIFGTDYAAGGIVLGILMVSVLAVFPNIILDNVIFTQNLQRKFILATLLGVTGNIALNFYLIPRFGAVGAAISTVAAQLIIMSINWRKLKKFLAFSVLYRVKKILAATVVMAVVVIAANVINLYFIITILIAIPTYLGMLYILKEPLIQEIRAIIQSR